MMRRHFLKLAGALTLGTIGTGCASLVSSPTNPALTTVTLGGGIRVHAIQTGWVSVKEAHRTLTNAPSLRIPAIITDRNWTEWLPIHTWLIEHPEGLILVDTGELNAAITDEEFFACDPGNDFFYSTMLRFAVEPEEELDAQLELLGYAPGDVRWVVMTHMHSDHADGLRSFGSNEVIVGPEDFSEGPGNLPCRWPEGFAPTLSSYVSDDTPGFGRSHRVTQAGDVRIVPTHGHSLGHQSLWVRTPERDYLFAGDASFTDVQLANGAVAGIVADVDANVSAHAEIKAMCRASPTVYMPSHDPDSVRRLLEGATFGA